MEQIEYSRTVVPSSMRSPYWKYFGFPSDSSNNILTRQKIVCTICNTTIAYNKNTSNLRTHLMSKHVEVFKEIVSLSNPYISLRNNTSQDNGEEQSNNAKVTECKKSQNFKRQCLELFDSGSEFTSSPQNENSSSTKYLNLPEYKLRESKTSSTRGNIPTFNTNLINFETQGADFIEYLPSDVTDISEEAVPSAVVLKDKTLDYAMNEKTNSCNNLGVYEEQDQQLHSMDIMLADYIQTDLLPLETLKEPGFCKYNQQLTGLNIDDNTIIRVKSIIETRFENFLQIIMDHVSRLSQSNPYSLSFEIYKDNEDQDILNIYFNYLNDKKEDLISVLYISNTICSKDVKVSELLSDINLNNCSGIVINFLENEFQFITDFANAQELPVIECLEGVFTRCLQKIFEKIEFYEDYEIFLKTILKDKSVILPVKSNLRSCKWNPFIILENIFTNDKDENIEKWDELKESFDYLKPLKEAIDIILNERLSLCSLTRPLIKKLFKDDFISTNQKGTRKYQIQKILEKELFERIWAKPFLKEVTFFDTRFHRKFALNDVFSDMPLLKSEILKRFKNILHVTYLDNINDASMEQNSPDSFVNIGKCSMENTKFDSNLKTNLDLEFEQYCNQECLDLDQSPILWWEQQSKNYKQLSKIANFYLTIPCCYMPRLCRFNLRERYSKLDRRKNLSQFCNIENKLWFLYYNDDVAEFF